MEDENVLLRRRVQELERQLLGRSPTKGRPLQEIKLPDVLDSEDKENEDQNVQRMASLHLHENDVFDAQLQPKQSKLVKSPGKKLRKLTPRTNVGFDDEDLTASDCL